MTICKWRNRHKLTKVVRNGFSPKFICLPSILPHCWARKYQTFNESLKNLQKEFFIFNFKQFHLIANTINPPTEWVSLICRVFFPAPQEQLTLFYSPLQSQTLAQCSALSSCLLSECRNECMNEWTVNQHSKDVFSELCWDRVGLSIYF